MWINTKKDEKDYMNIQNKFSNNSRNGGQCEKIMLMR